MITLYAKERTYSVDFGSKVLRKMGNANKVPFEYMQCCKENCIEFFNGNNVLLLKTSPVDKEMIRSIKKLFSGSV